MHTSPQQHRKTSKAFTLVEVVLALAVVAVAFVPVLGLLPVGVDVARKAIDATVEAQVTQQMVNQAQQTDFSLLPDLETGPSLYFDYQGNKVTEEKGIYEAVFTVSPSTALPSGSQTVLTNRLATVTISILNRTGKRSSTVSDVKANPDAKKYVVLIPDNGR